MLGFLAKFLDTNQKELSKLWPQVNSIGAFEEDVKRLSDQKLADKTKEFRQRLEKAEQLESVLVEAFACVREASRRTTNMRHFDVQLAAAIVLFRGKIAEQKTGEGKTLSATPALYLHALTGKGVHAVTVNDYLAKRDAEWMGPIFHALGLSVGVINHEKSYEYDPNPQTSQTEQEEVHLAREEAFTPETGGLGTGKYLRPVSRGEAYDADITYGTNNEFGFDYLRDNMVTDLKDQVQRSHYFAVVDEVDSILIDEARTPLIISAPDAEPTDRYYQFSKLVERLNAQADFVVDEKLKTVHLTDGGIVKIEQWLGVSNLYERDFETLHLVEQALKAKTLFTRDRDYIVRESEVIIVDEFTGRLMLGRRYSDGLHQAIEAKEGVKIQQESRTLATISFQNYFRMYQHLSGMTGTAATAAEEFHKIYKLDVMIIPTNKPMIRQDLADAVYKTAKAKYVAIVSDVADRYNKGQPVLIGTTAIDKNELIAQLLSRKNIKYQLLNAKNHQKEAQIIAMAGQKGAVTVATNIAGRGVDIKLGNGVAALGGLHVVGSERHEARRIDNQLRGRSGRQGDDGSSQFYVSLEDDIMRLFGGEQVARIMTALKMPEDLPISNPIVSRAIENAQNRVEGHNFDIRKHLVEYDDVMNKQREIIYDLRRGILNSASSASPQDSPATLKQMILDKLRQQISYIVTMHTQEGFTAEELETLVAQFCEIIPFDAASKERLLDQLRQQQPDEIVKTLTQIVDQVYQERTKQLSEAVMVEVEKFVMLSVIDHLWVEHLDAIDDLREGIGLRGYAQRDPLVEYKAEAFTMFEQLMNNIDYEITRRIFKIQVTPAQAPSQGFVRSANYGGQRSAIATGIGGKSSADSQKKLGRNDPCPCGSGLKWKKCGLINASEHNKILRPQ